MRGAKCSPCKRFEAWEEDDYGTDQPGRIGGFSLHAGVAVNTRERKKLERICRYISRPALSEARLELTDQGMVRYALKTAYLRGPIGMGRRMWYLSGAAFRHWIGTRSLYGQTGSIGAKATNQPDGAAQVRFHGVLARVGLPSNSRYRERITPTRSVKVKETTSDEEADGREEPDQTAGKRKGMCWTQRLKRVFNGAAQVLM